MAEKERKRIPRWKKVINCILILAALYWIIAPVTLWAWENTRHKETPYSEAIPVWWYGAYAPVIWAADRDILGPITMAPFEWLGVDSYVTIELVNKLGIRL